MPRRVVPSQVVAFIEQTFGPNEYSDDPKVQPAFGHFHSPQLSALLELTDGIPDELLMLAPDHSADFAVGRGAIRFALSRWSTEHRDYVLKPPSPRLRTSVALIYHALKGAHDEAVPAETAELRFLDDRTFAEVLRADLAAVERAHANGEWKAATVLAGSVVEALLLWALKRDGRASTANGAPKGKPDLDEWHFADLIRVAKELGLFSENTSTQIDLAKDYRNLIHPGRAIRKKADCDRGTARAASAALEFTIRELAARYAPLL